MTGYYVVRCEWCNEPIRRDESIAYLMDQGDCLRLHARCGRDWQWIKRDAIIDNIQDNNRLAAEVRSLVIHAPADPDGLDLRDGQIVAGWAV